MASGIVRCLRESLKTLDDVIAVIFGHRFPPGASCLASTHMSINPVPSKDPFTLENIFGGFLWAVPKNRRTIEKRWKRKYGSPEWGLKIYVPKTNLLTCNTCGHNHEAGFLCQHCYDKVMEETKVMQEKIQSELGLSPIEQDVVVLYNNEKEQQPPEFWKGKRIVEMKKERPPWFSKNLLQKSTQPPATSSDVKPTDLA